LPASSAQVSVKDRLTAGVHRLYTCFISLIADAGAISSRHFIYKNMARAGIFAGAGKNFSLYRARPKTIAFLALNLFGNVRLKHKNL